MGNSLIQWRDALFISFLRQTRAGSFPTRARLKIFKDGVLRTEVQSDTLLSVMMWLVAVDRGTAKYSRRTSVGVHENLSPIKICSRCMHLSIGAIFLGLKLWNGLPKLLLKHLTCWKFRIKDGTRLNQNYKEFLRRSIIITKVIIVPEILCDWLNLSVACGAIDTFPQLLMLNH